jgi:hypothetical protein
MQIKEGSVAPKSKFNPPEELVYRSGFSRKYSGEGYICYKGSLP